MAYEYAVDHTKKELTPLKAIRAKCLDCCCGQWYEVKMCTIDWCPLYEYRFGHDPNLQGKKKPKDPTFAARMAEAKARKAIDKEKEKK